MLGSRNCEILVLERRMRVSLSFFKVELTGSAALAYAASKNNLFAGAVFSTDCTPGGEQRLCSSRLRSCMEK